MCMSWGEYLDEYLKYLTHQEEEERRRQEEEEEERYEWYLEHREEYDLDYDYREQEMDIENCIEEERKTRENEIEEQWREYKANEDEGYCVYRRDIYEDSDYSEDIDPPEKGYFPRLSFKTYPLHDKEETNNSDVEIIDVKTNTNQMNNQQ